MTSMETDMIDKLDSSLRFQQEALNLRARRQEVIASNIAHADTPNYKARDFDFSSALTQALEQGRSALPMSSSAAGHQASRGAGSGADTELLYRIPAQTSADGNTVEMDQERVNFADNAMRYEANLAVLGSKIKTMLAALQS